MKKIQIFLLIILNLIFFSSCRKNKDSGSDNSTAIISGYISSNSASSKSVSTSTLEDIRYIAAIPINSDGNAYWVKLSDNGQFSFTVASKGSYIFKLVDEYGLTRRELAFGDETYNVFSVQDSTDFGNVEFNDTNTNLALSSLNGTNRDNANINETLVNSILISLLETLLNNGNKGKLVYTDKNNIEVNLVLNRSLDSDGRAIEQRLNLTLDNKPAEYGELNFIDKISLGIVVVDSAANDIDATTLYSSDNYLIDDTVSLMESYSEELIKISTLIKNITDSDSFVQDNFQSIVDLFNQGESLSEASSEIINSNNYTALVEKSREEAHTLIHGDAETISLKSLPDKTSYLIGDTFDYSGLEINVNYEDGSSETLDNSKISITGFDSSSSGIKTITATYDELSVTFAVNITSSSPVNITKSINIGSVSYSINIQYYSGTFGYEINNNEVTITDSLVDDTSLTIPTTIDGYPVTTIGFAAFFNNNLSGISIPDSVTSIEDYAFRNNSLTSIVIPTSVIDIGNNAFESNLITSISIPDSVTSLGSGAFRENQITTLTLSNSITEIPDYAFYNNQITSVTIPNGVTRIGDYAFKNNSLTSMSIPSTVTKVGEHAFYGNDLTTVTLPDSITEIGNYAFKNNALTTISVPESITEIGAGAFENNSLTTISLPDSVTEIGGFAFYGNNLTGVTLPNSLKQIDSLAFAENQITSITFPETITGFGEGAFFDNDLTEITLPDSITEISAHAFGNNSNLAEIYIPNTVTSIDSSAFENSSENLAILGEAGSVAATYAADNGFDFELDLGSFSISSQPDKTTYYTEDSFDYSGLVVTISYTNGDSDIIDNSEITFTGFDNSTAGAQTITATYGDFSDTFEITMISLVLENLAITNEVTKTTYYTGDTFEYTGLELTATYNSGETSIIDNSKVTFTGFDSSTGGTQTITATYDNASTTIEITMIDTVLNTITISTEPDKTTYYTEDSFDYTGLIVTANYNNGDDITIDNSTLSFSGFDTTIAGTQTITVTHNGVSNTFNITMIELTVDTITITSEPDKTTYYTDDSFDYTGLIITASYNNGSDITIDNSELSFSGYDNSTSGTQTITVSYSAQTTSFDVIMIETAIDSISITTEPDKTTYYTGDSFDYTGLIVTASYNNGSDITIDNSELSFSGFDNSTSGTQTITVSYSAQTTSFDVIMIETAIDSISIATEPDKTTYYTGDTFDYSGLVVTANYNNGDTTIVDNSTLSLSGYDNTTAGTQTITVMSSGLTNTFDIMMVDLDISSITITTEADKTTYYTGDSFDYTGLVVTANYNNGDTTIVDNSTLSFSGFDSSTAGTQTITISYSAQTSTFNITMIETAIDSISITTEADKTTYYTGDSFDYTGLVVTANYNSGDTTTVDNSTLSFSGFDNSTSGTQTITVSYGAQTNTFNITMIETAIDSISITSEPDKTTYYTGDTFDYSGLVVAANYNNGDTTVVDNSTLSFSGFDNSTSGIQTITVSYGAQTNTFNITMIETAIDSISITTEPDKTTYYTGDSFDYTGLVVTANYNSGDTTVVDNSTLSFSGYDNTTSGTQTITVSYGAQTNTFNITMIETAIDSITITTEPDKTTYYTGDSFDYTGLVVTANYNSGDTTTVDNSALSFSGFDNSTSGTQTITVTYETFNDTFDITMVGLSSFDITTEPSETSYLVGETFDYSGMVATATYTDSHTATIDNANISFSGFDNSSEATITVTTTYQGYSDTFTVNIYTDYNSDYSYSISGNEVTISSYTGSDTDPSIPSSIEGYSVTTIANNAFEDKGLNSVTLADSITTIGNSAFKDNYFTSISLPTSLTSIGEYAFYGNSLGNISLPDSTISIGNYAFAYNSLATATLPSSITELNEGVFYNNSLTSITLPSTITTIEASALRDNQLSEVTLPSSLTTIGAYAFQDNSLAGIETSMAVTSIGNYAFAYNSPLDEAFIQNPSTTLGTGVFNSSGTEFTIYGEAGSTVETYASNNSHDFLLDIETFTITTEPTTTSYYVGESLDTTGIKASVTYYNGNSGIIDDTYMTFTGFDSATADTTITVTATHGDLNDTFDVNIYTDYSGVYSYSITNEEVTITDYLDSNITVVIPSSIDGSPVTTIGASAFSGDSISQVNIPDSVITIEDYAFDNNYLTTVSIPDSVTDIGNGAFQNNSSLETVYITDSVTTIGTSVFDYSSQTFTIYGEAGSAAETYANTNGHQFILDLTSFGISSLPTTTFYVGDGFDDTGLEASVTYSSGNTGTIDGSYLTYDGFINEISETITMTANYESFSDTFAIDIVAIAMTGFSITTEPSDLYYSIGDSSNFSDIAAEAIFNNGDTVTLGEGVLIITGFDNTSAGTQTITVSYGSFNDTFNITMYEYSYTVSSNEVSIDRYLGSTYNLSIPDTIEGYPVTTIADNAFVEEGIRSVSFPETITYIGMDSFVIHEMSTVTIPSSVETIGNNAFYNNGYFVDVYVESSNATIGTDAFHNDGTTLTFHGESGSTIETYAYNSGDNFIPTDMTYTSSGSEITITGYSGTSASIIIPDTIDGLPVTIIADNAFDSKELTSITLGVNITTIGASAFYGNSLSSVTIPDNTSSIGLLAFDGNGEIILYVSSSATTAISTVTDYITNANDSEITMSLIGG